MTGWSDCLPLSPDSHCGFGLQTRNVTCVLFPAWPRVETDARECEEVAAPGRERLCAVRCGEDCELGPWQGWARCEDGVTSRVRRVISPPAAGGSKCPPRVQRRHCPSATPLPLLLPLRSPGQVTVYVGPWSNCTVDRQLTRRSVSGSSSVVARYLSGQTLPDTQHSSPAPEIGQRWREVLCRGEDGQSLAWSNCMDGSRATVVPAERQSCVLQRDCRVSQWSDWRRRELSQFCGEEEVGELRSRQILTFSEGAGRACPHLQESRPLSSSSQCKFR